MDNLFEAVKLLIVGLTTVFAVLLIIIYGGKLLIKAVNKFIPEEEPVLAKQVSAAPQAVSPQVAKVIEEAVNQITGGSGQVIKIEKQ